MITILLSLLVGILLGGLISLCLIPDFVVWLIEDFFNILSGKNNEQK